MRTTAAVFSHNGLGDGVNSLVLSNNLHLNGWSVDTYQNTIGSMQEWFPHLKVVPYPSLEEIPRILSRYDWFFVVHNDTDFFVQTLIREGKRKYPEKVKVIYLYPSRNIVNEPYYADCLIDPEASIVENLVSFCQKVLHLSKKTNHNGFIPPQDVVYKKYSHRVVIHPTSARSTRNWPKDKFVKLALHLKSLGYQTIFVPGKIENDSEWNILKENQLETAYFPNLDKLARFIYESGYLIGNDSGLGHLASALGIPTLTLCRRKAWSKMWAPSFAPGIVLTPNSWIPNISGFRFRDKYWRHLISVRKAKKGFAKLKEL